MIATISVRYLSIVAVALLVLAAFFWLASSAFAHDDTTSRTCRLSIADRVIVDDSIADCPTCNPAKQVQFCSSQLSAHAILATAPVDPVPPGAVLAGMRPDDWSVSSRHLTPELAPPQSFSRA